MRHLLLPALLPLLIGCASNDDTGSPETGDSSVDTGDSDSGETADTETGDTETGESGDSDTGPSGRFHLLVLDPTKPDDTPVAGVTIAVDTRGGDRLEVTTDEIGKATVETAVEDVTGIICHADGRSFSAASPAFAAAAVAADSPVILSSWALSVPPTDDPVTVSGALLNKAAFEHEVRVSASGGTEYNRRDTTEYDVLLPPNVDFTLTALEWETNSTAERVVDETFYGWLTQVHPGVAESTVVDLDFASPAVTRTVHGSVAMPSSDLFEEHGRLEVLVNGATPVGHAFSTAPSEDNRAFAFTAQFLDLPAETLETTLYVSDPDGDYSLVYLEGAVPTAGVQRADLLSPPRRLGPVGDGPFEWSTPAAWNPMDITDAETSIVLSYTSDTEPIGVGYVLSDEGGFDLPDLPSTSTRLSDGPIHAAVALCQTTDDDPRCEKWTQEFAFELTSPFARGG